jgi:hypothetical protein
MKIKAKMNAKKPKTIVTQKDALKEIIAQTWVITRLLAPGSPGDLGGGKCSAATWRKVGAAIKQIAKIRKTFGPGRRGVRDL